jgi:hypothetical protein
MSQLQPVVDLQVAVDVPVSPAYRGQVLSEGRLSATVHVARGEPVDARCGFSFRNADFGLAFSAATASLSPSCDVVCGLGQAEGDLKGTYAYEVQLGSRGVRFVLKGEDGAEIFVAEAGRLAAGPPVREVTLLQQPDQPVCTCRGTVTGTTQEGTLLNIDICPGCNLEASVVHIEAGFADLIFDATTFTQAGCAPTTLGLQLVAEGTGITNRCGTATFFLELVNQRVLSYLIMGQGPGCFVAELENTSLPIVEPCVPVSTFRGLGRLITRL